MVRKFLALIAIAIPLALTACGSSDNSSSSTAAASDTGATSTTEASTTQSSGGGGSSASSSSTGGGVSISETEYQLDPSGPSTKAGNVTLDVSNDGTTVHDLEIEGNGVEQSTDPIEAGSSAKLSVDLKPGTYEIYCNIANHRAMGMEGTLTVQ